MTTAQPSSHCSPTDGTVEIHISELAQLFNSLDPSPFYEKELDRNAEEYIVRSAQELPNKSPAVLVVYLSKASKTTDEGRMLSEAIHVHFARQAQRLRRELRQLLRRGSVNLGIGLAFLALCLIGGQIMLRLMGEIPVARVLRESFLICGWVAMWNPIEIFLYDWWPILGQCRVYERLSRIQVRVVYNGLPGLPSVDTR
jgi:hypothetical protein